MWLWIRYSVMQVWVVVGWEDWGNENCHPGAAQFSSEDARQGPYMWSRSRMRTRQRGMVAVIVLHAEVVPFARIVRGGAQDGDCMEQ
jgi:hypothetical protein